MGYGFSIAKKINPLSLSPPPLKISGYAADL